MIRLASALLILLLSPAFLQAGFVATFVNDGSGGVTATFQGTGTFLVDGPAGSLTFIDVGNMFDGGNDISADSVSGTFTVDGNAINVTSIVIDEDGAADGDDLTINYTGSINTTPPAGQYIFDLTANWNVGTLPFSAFNPGTYGPGTSTDQPEFDNIQFFVVPEPTSFALTGLCVFGFAFRRQQRRS